MDPIPQIPSATQENDTICLIRNTFEEKLEKEVFPEDIATSLVTYSVDDNLSLKENARNVFAIYGILQEESETIKNAEYDIIKQHADYLFAKNVIEKNQFLKELMKLKPCDIFHDMCLPDKLKFGLIEKCDLYPDITRQFLDFRFNTTLHSCKRCFPREETAYKISKPRREIPFNIPTAKKRKESSDIVVLQMEPPEIIFRNFELNTEYEQPFKIKNISLQMHKMSIRTYPKSSVFTLKFKACQKMAPGMYAYGIIKFKPEVFINMHDHASFISRRGEVVTLSIRCIRDPPKLSAYIHKSIEYPKLAGRHIPGSRQFSIRRQHAVNNTIDCGSCFATEHVLISLIISNNGHKAKFFWLSEEDFYYQDIKTISTNLELTKDCFWIYPTYFEMLHGDICEINILFQPLYCGFQTQTFFLMCDTNNYRQIELIGDAVCFNKKMISIEVPYQTNELEKKENHCIFLGHVRYKEIIKFTLAIINRSPIFLKYGIEFRVMNEKFSMREWIKVANSMPTHLAPNSTTDIIFETECPSDVTKEYYNTKLRFFIKDVPIASLEAEDKFLVSTNGKELKEITENLSTVDVLITELEVACYVDPIIEVEKIEELVECEYCGNLGCTCTACGEVIPSANLEFAQPFLEFGILPVGADIKKNFFITNLGANEFKWKIMELKYNIDSHPFVEVVEEKNLSVYGGTLKPRKKQRLTYNIVKKGPARYVSILVLFSVNVNSSQHDGINKNQLVAESICLVTYEITELNIIIKTGQSLEPILCPMQMLYTGVQVNVSFKIQNYSLIPGCFYLLPPVGSDADKVEVDYKPRSGELPPGANRKIRLKLTCNEVGILENIFIPCFIGKNQEPIQLRLLCVVDCVHVFFYLPTKNNEYQKILWPPKVIYEYDHTWSNYCICGESSYEYENTINNIQSDYELQMIKKSNDTLNSIKHSKINVSEITEEKIEESDPDILSTLVTADSEIFLQDCVMEVRKVFIKEPKKITLYLENVTPKPAKYSVQCTNFAAKENKIKACLGPKYKKTEVMWEPMIENYGILVHPEVENSYMKPYELVTVDIWIYANTWGIYAEEVIIDIDNITSFSFSLIIEVIGCPLELPMSIGAITKYPTIRLGSVASESDPIQRDIVIRNISSIDMTVSWHVFYLDEDYDTTTPFNFVCDIVDKSEEEFEFNFTDRFFGIEGFDCIEVEPRKLNITQGDQLSVPIKFTPQQVTCYRKRCPLRCFLLGRIFLKENDRLKSNYFYRKNNSLIIEITANIEMPCLDVEIEDDTLQIYANDVAIKRQTYYYIKCIIRNPTCSIIKAEMDCMEPFSFGKMENKITLEPGRCKEIHLPCNITYEKILKWAPHVYRKTEVKTLLPLQSPDSNLRALEEVQLISSEDKVIDDDQKAVMFRKKLVIYYQGGFKNVIPVNANIYYPNIAVKPVHVKFGFILLGRTEKAVISIYNLTGCAILFEIFKSMSTQELVVTPPHGEIPKSTGINHSFTNIIIFFTPTECRTYHESIRIVTNIPQYYIDIPIKGSASFNEKFD